MFFLRRLRLTLCWSNLLVRHSSFRLLRLDALLCHCCRFSLLDSICWHFNPFEHYLLLCLECLVPCPDDSNLPLFSTFLFCLQMLDPPCLVPHMIFLFAPFQVLLQYCIPQIVANLVKFLQRRCCFLAFLSHRFLNHFVFLYFPIVLEKLKSDLVQLQLLFNLSLNVTDSLMVLDKFNF